MQRQLLILATSLAALFTLTASASTAAAESFAAPDPWPTELVGEDTPPCMDVEHQSRTDTLLVIENGCDKKVTLDVLECLGVTCEMKPTVETAPDETGTVEAAMLGIESSDFSEDTEYQITFGWSQEPDKEGTITLKAQYFEPNTGGGCGGCGAEPTYAKSQPPVGTMGIVFVGLALLRTRRR